MFVTGVAKKYIQGHAKFHPRASKYWFIYGYTETGKFFSKRIHSYEVPFYKRIRKKLQLFQCAKCFVKFKSIKGSTPTCPNCG